MESLEEYLATIEPDPEFVERTRRAVHRFPVRSFEKTCAICGDEFTSRSQRAKYCSQKCRRIGHYKSWQRCSGREDVPRSVGVGAECAHCGKPFVTRSSKHIYCTKHCASASYHARNNKNRIPETIICEVCGEEIECTCANLRHCQHKCKPQPGFVRKCSCCGEVKGYDDYYDHRGNTPDSKLMSECKDCMRAKSRNRWRKENADDR